MKPRDIGSLLCALLLVFSARHADAEEAASTSSAAPCASVEETVRLHVEAPVPVVVVEHHGSDLDAHSDATVCSGPCDTSLDTRGRTYWVEGRGVDPAPIYFDGRTGDVNVSVRPGKLSLRVAGTVVGLTGILSLATGFATLVCGIESLCSAAEGKGFRSAGARAAGVALAGGGLVFTVTGLTLMVDNITHLDVSPPRERGTRLASRKPRYWAGEF